MADVFISYKREDRRAAERLSIVLEQLGFNVWWDFDLICGDQFRRAIEKIIDECSAAVVLWSVLSRESTFVVDEAAYAREQGKLCPARIDDCRIPLGFGGDHVVSLRDWDGEIGHEGLQALLRAIELKTGKKARLGAPARDAEDDERFAEMEAFKAAQAAQSLSALRSFLREYPDGAFAKFVRGQVSEIEAQAAAPVVVTAGEPALAPPRPAPPESSVPRQPDLQIAPPRLGSTRSETGKLRQPLMWGGAAAVAAVIALFAIATRPWESNVIVPAATSAVEQAQTDLAAEDTAPADGAASAPADAAVETPDHSQAVNTTAPPQSSARLFEPYDLSILGPEVREVVEAARLAEQRAESTAERARAAARLAAQAASHARAGRGGYMTSDYRLSDGVGQYAGERAGSGRHLAVLVTASGQQYAGEWSGPIWDGVGVFVRTESRRYEGEYSRTVPIGGVLYTRAGRVATEETGRQWQRHGVYHFANGTRYEGEFRSSSADEIPQRDGRGVLWDAEGDVISVGIWADDRLTTR